jgi:hypothetical protein
VTSRQVALLVYSPTEVLIAERLRLFHQFLGNAFERVFADAVGGQLGGSGKGNPDVITDQGEFEFCTQRNTKNAAGAAHDRATGRPIVQILEEPLAGRMSAVDFLELHDIADAKRVTEVLIGQAAEQARARADGTLL